MDTDASTPAESRDIRDVLRSLAPPVYLPVLMVGSGAAVLVPVLPLYLLDRGLSATTIGAVMAAAGVGGFVSQFAIGRAMDRISETTVMVAAIVVVSVSVAVLGVVGAALGLAALRFVSGIGSAGWVLSRQSFMTRTVEPAARGRALSVFGGTNRLAFFAGPPLGGWLSEVFGFATAFCVSAALSAAGLVPLLLWHSRQTRSAPTHDVARADQIETARPNVTRAEEQERQAAKSASLREHAGILALAGFGQLLIIAVRQGRFIVLPLIGVEVGLSPQEIGALIGVGGFIDLVIFPVAGYLMDRFGRLAAIVPAFSGLGAGLIILAFANTPVSVTIAALVIGLGNGLGSGTMLTVSSDLAPQESPGEFLGVLGTIRDAGKILGPVVVGGLADAAGLGPASFVLGILAFASVTTLTFGVGETRDRQSPSLRPSPITAR